MCNKSFGVIVSKDRGVASKHTNAIVTWAIMIVFVNLGPGLMGQGYSPSTKKKKKKIMFRQK